MILAAHAAPQKAQKTIMNLGEGVVVSNHQPLQPVRLEQLAEHVFEYVHAVRETVENLLGCPVGAARCAAVEHPALHSFFDFEWGKVGQSQEVLGLVVRALLHELLPPLVVDDARYAIWKRALLGIASRTA